MIFHRLITLLSLPLILTSSELSHSSLHTLFCSLNPHSITQLTAFHHLYPDTQEGQQALEHVWDLIYKHRPDTPSSPQSIPIHSLDILTFIRFINQTPNETTPLLSDTEISQLETLCDHLNNRSLPGHYVTHTSQIPSLSPSDIDVARALLLYQFDNDIQKIKSYEASLDIMSLQILGHLPKSPSNKEKIDAINHFIFHEKRFRFPPQSLHAKDIDTYTFLPSVIDSRLGVCLGVSILYLSIAERIGLPLQIITPPGHIYLNYHDKDTHKNIETTALGIHLEDNQYLSIHTRKLQQRNKKEVVGLAFFNQASLCWEKNRHNTAIELYEQALLFLPDDILLKQFLAYNYLFTDQKKRGKKMLSEVKDIVPDHGISKYTTPEDFLTNNVDIDGIKTLFMHVDDTRLSILNKQKRLQTTINKYPKFREGLLQLATTHLQLGRTKEALAILNQYHKIDPTSPVVEYYLTSLCLHRFLYKKAWTHFLATTALTRKRSHNPKCLKPLKQELIENCGPYSHSRLYTETTVPALALKASTSLHQNLEKETH